MSSSSPGRVVVGLDGSPESLRALDWAADYCALTGLHLYAIMAWGGLESYVLDEAALTIRPIKSEAWGVIDSAMAEVTRRHPSVISDASARRGYAGQVLVEASKKAKLLVVGNRGHRGIGGALRGSVSHYCATHASCPVVVVRPDAGESSPTSPGGV